MKLVRIFISSPGDVKEERDRARQVVESLRRRYAGRLDLRPMLWEDLPLQPDMSFQQGIDEILSERGVDVAVFILWSRLGTPTGPMVVKSDGASYRSGTEREYDLMMEAREQSRATDGKARPDVLVYTRRDEASFEERLRGESTEDKQAIIAQKKQVENFITENFQDAESGTNIGAHLVFDRPVTFQQRLRSHLEDLLDPIAGIDSADPVWDIDTMGSPFPGLESYQFQHAPVFFGREDQIVSARHALRNHARGGCAFLLIQGASGSGKSSLARAGILPAIVDLEVDDVVESWQTIEITPGELGGDLTGGFAAKLAAVLPELNPGAQEYADFTAQLRENPGFAWRHFIRKALGEKERLIILVDQLEELFTSAEVDDAARETFSIVLETLACSGSVWIVVTMRSDFAHLCQSVPALFRMTQQREMGLLPPGADALSRVITDPARLAGLYYQKRSDGVSLRDVLLREATEHRELLPFLSHILRRLVELRTQQGELTFEAYEKTLGGKDGNLREALAIYAEEVYQGLPEASREKLPDVWARLITLGGEDGSQALRQYPSLQEMTGDPDMELLVKRFIDARLFTASGDAAKNEALVTVAHEALLRIWDRAKDWIAKNRKYLQVRADVERYRELWVKSAPDAAEKRDPSLLLPPGMAIRQAKDLQQNHGAVSIESIKDYIDLSLRRAFLKKVRSVSLLAGVAALAAILGIGGLLLYYMGSPIFSGEEKALEKFHKELYEKEIQMQGPPQALVDPARADRPLDVYKNRLGMEMIWCWPGTFAMGCSKEEPSGEEFERQHTVTLTRGFRMARHEVTQGQWRKIMEKNSNQVRDNKNLPVEGVSWHGAVLFCRTLTELERSTGSIPANWEYTLPTEAQWEYACRAGSAAPFSGPDIGSTAWYFKNAFFHSHEVGKKLPNRWGFHDMHGNVWEWCSDWFGEYPASGRSIDPTGPADGQTKVDRGGGWFGFAKYCRSAARDSFPPDSKYFNMIGFRPVLREI